MKLKLTGFLLLIFLISGLFVLNWSGGQVKNNLYAGKSDDKGGINKMVDKVLKEMTLEEKVGQLFQVGFSGTKVTPEIKELIEKYHIGGVIYFRRNITSIEQVTQLSNELQEIAMSKENGIPLIISVDQEGGIVTRIKDATHFPGNMAIGATGESELAYKAGMGAGKELKALGINMNLAPVLDVNNNPYNPVIGVRSFGEDPEKVAQLGAAYVKGLQEEGVIACGKHFPGHGDTDTDSHLNLPIIKHDLNRLNEVELLPFKEAIKTGIDSIMTAHVYFPAIESKEGIPATLSRKVLTGLLREELGYNGLIITDCMEMDAIVKTFGTVEGAIMTIEAGSDMVLISHTFARQKEAIRALIDGVKEGRISEERINQSVKRILTLKEKRLGLAKKPVATGKIDYQAGWEIAYNIAKKAVTLVKNENNLIPVAKGQKVVVLDFSQGQLSLVEDNRKVDNLIVKYLNDWGVNTDYYQLAVNRPTIPDLTDYDRVIVCTSSAILQPDQARVVRELYQKNLPIIVFAIRNPYDLRAFSDVETYLTTYDYSPANILAAFEVLVGKLKPQGILPVSLGL